MMFVNRAAPGASAALHLLASHPLFAGLSTNCLAPLLTGGLERRLDIEETLFNQNQSAEHWWVIVDGELEALRHGNDGEERFFGLFQRGGLIGEAAMFIPERRYPVAARARVPTRLIQMERSPLRRLCEENGLIAVRLLEQTTRRLCRRVQELERLAGSSAAQRLAEHFLALQRLQGRQLQLPLNQRQLAATLGVRAETINRLLGDWLRAGYISGARRNWELIDSCALARIAGLQPCAGGCCVDDFVHFGLAGGGH